MPEAHAVVLLVQPNDDARDMYAEFLRHQGLSPIVATNAREAVSAAPSVDVVITGILLPGRIDGIELIARLRARERKRHTPIIVLTASLLNEERERAQRAGCDVFLSKPCLPDQLLREIRRVLPSSRPKTRESSRPASAAGRSARKSKRKA